MTISEIKDKMKLYTDFYGGDLLDTKEIDEAKTKAQLSLIIEKHRDHLESMLSDAHSHLDAFKTEMGLNFLT